MINHMTIQKFIEGYMYLKKLLEHREKSTQNVLEVKVLRAYAVPETVSFPQLTIRDSKVG